MSQGMKGAKSDFETERVIAVKKNSGDHLSSFVSELM